MTNLGKNRWICLINLQKTAITIRYSQVKKGKQVLFPAILHCLFTPFERLNPVNKRRIDLLNFESRITDLPDE